MGVPEIPERGTAKLFVGVMYSDESLKRGALEDFKRRAGTPCLWYGAVDFTDYSDYYNAEMGERILKTYYVFNDWFDPSCISEIKHLTNSIEQRYAVEGKRRVNLDPGYITRAKLVLATTKNYSHRVYLRDGIYAEVTLSYSQGKFNPFEWTYPDYRDPGLIQMLLKARADIAGSIRKDKKRG